jgi:hypothetical protein
MSDTPRTDEASLVDTNYDVETVKADFARQLERENAALSAQVAESEQQHESDKNWLRAQRDVAEEKLRDMTKERDEYKGCVELGIDDAASDMADFSAMRIRAEAAEAQVAELCKLYEELLYAVARKFPGETRHQTALRYINNAETVSVSSGCDAAKESG